MFFLKQNLGMCQEFLSKWRTSHLSAHTQLQVRFLKNHKIHDNSDYFSSIFYQYS